MALLQINTCNSFLKYMSFQYVYQILGANNYEGQQHTGKHNWSRVWGEGVREGLLGRELNPLCAFRGKEAESCVPTFPGLCLSPVFRVVSSLLALLQSHPFVIPSPGFSS